MGYYSIYRMIKDIIKTIFGSKVWRFILIFLIVFSIYFFININKSKASYSLELFSGSVTLPSWIDGSTYNAYIFQSDMDNNGNYNFFTIFTRGGGNLVLSSYLNENAFTNTGNGQGIRNRSNVFTSFTGTVSQYQSYLNSNFGWSSGSVGNSNMYWVTWTPYSQLSSYGIDAENCYINGTQDILNTDNSVYIEGNTLYIPDSLVIHPSFDTPKTDIENLSFDNLFVSPGDWDLSTPLYLHRLEITQTVNDDQNVIYYYGDKIFRLDTSSSYYTQYLDSDIYYFSIRKSKFNFDVNTSYLLVLDDSSELYTNSVGLIEKDWDNNIFDVASINTTGIITAQDVIKDNTDNISDDLTNTTPDSSVSSDIDDALNFDNQNDDLNNLNNGFFTRLTTMLANLVDYSLSEDTAVSLPMPNSNKTIVLHSIDIYNNVIGALRLIINAFWVYIFSFYLWKFINKIYIAVSTGNILDKFSSSGEAITNDML